jgi:hypothetical protein
MPRSNAVVATSVMRLAAVATTHCGRPSGAADAGALTTVAEQSHFKRTGRYEEVEKLCAAFERAFPSRVRCVEFGRTPENRSMRALIASDDGALDPVTARQKNRPVVLMQGGIHGGEIDGKDAGFLALREMLEGKAANGALGRATFVFVPVFNVDGHERFGRWNRPNQIGPEEMGWRTTAQNLNLNRDYVKAEAPEMHAMLRLLGQWDPIVFADLHVTDGAQFEHDVSINVAPTLAGDEELRKAGDELRGELMRRLTAQGSLPLDFYPSFVRDDDPGSGFAVNVAQTRFSQQYWATRNRLGVLVETHSWKDYPTRVRVTHNAIVAMMELVAGRGADWLAVARGADQRATRIGGSSVPLTFENTDHVTTIDFRGYAYTREPSAISGALLARYDPTRPQVWHIPLRDQIRPAVTVIAPNGGYIVPAAYVGWVRDKLALHGIESRTIAAAMPSTAVRTFRAVKSSIAPATFEGRIVLSLEGEWKDETRDVPAGSLYVPIAQAKSHLVLTLFEPKEPDSLASWGFFTPAFERKEYMEAYVAEDVARETLKRDPEAKKEFERRLREDPEFAKSPAARLDFFYQRHASWDERFNLYPIYRIDREP